MLKKIRIILATVMIVCITLLFLGIGDRWLFWAADSQFLPSFSRILIEAALGNIAILCGLVLLTLLLGRVYCSVICPLGIFQDIIIKLHTLTGGKKARRRFHYIKEHKIARYSIAVLFWASQIVNIQVIFILLDPYSAYGRMIASVLGLSKGNFVPTLLIIAVATLIIITVCAWLWGREYCNTVCPVGTTLSLVSRFAIFRPTIDPDACKHCHGCEKQCKSGCIDSANMSIDYSRCVACMDCISDCHFGAIKLKASVPASSGGATDKGRRRFLAVSALLAGSAELAKAQNKKVDGGLAPVIAKTEPERECRIVPPGAGSLKKLQDLCTGCQLCISTCPNNVLRPSTRLDSLLQPYMSYEKGYCRPECTACSDVCPTGAIIHIEPEAKTSIRIGTAHVDLDLCVILRDNVACRSCSSHCPTGAILMVKDKESGRMIPSVTEEQCIGCGACEHLCPSRPVSAIKVNGLSTHLIK